MKMAVTVKRFPSGICSPQMRYTHSVNVQISMATPTVSIRIHRIH